jgi:valacyclovir hydrolase
VTWFEHGASRIYFEDAGQGVPVLFLPGWSESVDDFQRLRSELSRRYRVIAADLPGSGKSGPQPREYTAVYYHEDAETFLALLEWLVVDRAHVVGFSDGGEVALLMAARNPAALRSVIVWGAAGQLVTPPAMVDAFFDLVDAPVEEMRGFSDYLRGVYGETNARAMSRSVATAWRSMSASGGDISRSVAGAMACPVLLITGEHDPYAPPRVVRDLAGDMPDGHFVECGGAGHMLHVDRPDWLAETIVSWLDAMST